MPQFKAGCGAAEGAIISSHDKSSGQAEATEDRPLPSSADLQLHREQTMIGQRARAKDLRQKRLNWAIFQFLSGWLSFLVVLVIIALLSNLEWARPRVQEEMSRTFHRQVKLGRLSWVLGLNGLAISTDRLSMFEADGAPFIVSGHSEIGVAVLPLFSKRLLVKHVEFHKPEVFATQVAPGKWNFSDLLVEGPEIRFVQVEQGRLHLRNRLKAEQTLHDGSVSLFSNTRWQSYDFEDVNLKFVFPQKNQKRSWPLYLSFKMPGEEHGERYITSMSMTLLARGDLDKWQWRDANVEMRASQFNPDDWRALFSLPQGIDGMFDWDYKGKGQFRQSISGDIKYSARNIVVENDGQQIFRANEASGKGRLSISEGLISWSDADLGIGGIALKSKGKVWDLQNSLPHYDGVVSANLQDLTRLSDSPLLKFLPGFKDKPKKNDLAGSAVVEVQFSGGPDEHRVVTSFKADNIPLASLLGGGTRGGAQLLSLFEIQPNARIKGHITVGSDQRIVLEDVEIPAGHSVLKVQGFIDAAGKTHDIYLQSDGLALDKLDTTELAQQPAPKDGSALTLTGKVDFKAHLQAQNKRHKIEIDGRLRQASLASKSAGTLAKDLVGTIKFDGDKIVFDQIKGALATSGVRAGTVMCSGFMDVDRRGKCELELSGRQVDVGKLLSFARSAKLPLPEGGIDSLHGVAQDLNIQVTGETADPQLTLNLSPQDIKYVVLPSADGPLKPIQASGGNVIVSKRVALVRNMVLSFGGSKVIASAAFDRHDQELNLRSLQLKSDSFNIADLIDYLNSKSVPPQVRQDVLAMFAPLKPKTLRGKLYCDLGVRFRQSGRSIDGIAGLNGVSGEFGADELPFERAFGQLVFTGEDIALQDMTLRLGGGRYNLTGEIKAFQQKPVWNAEVKGKVRGKELTRLLPAQFNAVKFDSSSPVAVSGTFSGDDSGLKANFVLQAERDEKFSLRAPMFSLSQPAGLPLTVEAAAEYRLSGNKNMLNIRSCRMKIADALVQSSAQMSWMTDGSKKPSVDFIMSTPAPIATGVAVAAFFPNIDATGASGTIKTTIAAAGEPERLLTHGELIMTAVSLPSLRIKQVDGKIDSPRWVMSSTASDKIKSEARINLNQANIGNVDAANLQATLKLESSAQPRISLVNGSVGVAGGQVILNGYFEPDSSRWHLALGLEKLQVDQFVSDLIEQNSEVTGLADGHIELSSVAGKNNIAQLSGNGHIDIYKGSVSRVGQLHEKLQAANLIQQGIFGFNLNNVFHSMLPVRTGKFKEVNVNFTVDNGVVNIDRLNFDGNDLRLRAAGKWSIADNLVNLSVAGNIPRVASSILPGAVGEATRNFTLQKAVRLMTFRKLESLPSLPILGDLASDEPRAFLFKVAGNANAPEVVAKSIEKSFQWLPNKPNASAHPVLGL